MTLDIKTCGLSTPETVDAALDAGADMIGFVFFPKSPRAVTADRAAELAKPARNRTAIVSLSVNMDDAGLEAIVSILKPDLLQLHGSETPERVREVKEKFGRPVMKAIGVANAGDLDVITSYQGVADRLLIDAKPPKDADLPGGNGLAFDWRLIERLSEETPFMLSGGLTVDNVADAIRMTHPGGVDVSSGIEREKGIKDPDLIYQFIRHAREAVQA
ncbi:phosphoribosylanthranilate isomerase [Coralliovum pocilloporae]|uniref:phosphoribosylanthranilate isomerase n=1 Tax=Coralliovum pocilloporae TaxID=3066369 RepID=UPI003307C1B9